MALENPILNTGGMLTSNGYELDTSTARLGELRPVPDRERSDLPALRSRFRRDGYLFLPGALDPDAVRIFRRYYFSSLSGTGLTRPGTDPGDGIAGPGEPDRTALRSKLFRDVVPGSAYLDFCTQPAIRAWYEWFLGSDAFLHRRKILRHIRPGERGVGTATQAHYDLVYIREGTDQVLTSWIPLGDCPVERGGLMYLEGSHVWARAEVDGGLRRPAASITADVRTLADDVDGRWLVGDYAAGDMVVHSAYTVHAALDNVDSRGTIRLSTDIRYQRGDDPVDQRWQQHWHDRDGL